MGYGQSKILLAADFCGEDGSLDAWKSEDNVDLEPAIQDETKNEEIIFNTPRTEEDLHIASKVAIDDKRLSMKVWRHPDFFGLEKPSRGSSKTPRADFFSKHRLSVRKSLKDHLMSENTRCFRNGFYREQNIPYDFYYNNVTGRIILVDVETQEVFSFWEISRMQRLELLNHNHIHKHWRLIDKINERRLQLQKKAKAEVQQTLEEESLNLENNKNDHKNDP